MLKFLSDKARKHPQLRNFIRIAKMYYVHRRLGLSHVHKTFYVNTPYEISKDLITGQYCFMGSGCWICPNVTIGNYVMIAPDCAIIGGDHIFDKVGVPIIFSGRPAIPKTVIDDDVWIGYRSIITAGVHIGRGAIVAAGSVVTKSVEPYSIVGGIPALFLKKRFNNDNDIERHNDMLNQNPQMGEYVFPK